MSKRRRERDRPKSGPDASYDPNKRVLLSYASDEESPEDLNSGLARDESSLLAANSQSIAKSHHDNAEMATEPGIAEDIAPKEQVVDEAACDDEDIDEQHPPHQDNTRERHGVRRNHATGQMAALGSLSYQWEDEQEYEEEYDSEAEDAMSYLRAVR